VGSVGARRRAAAIVNNIWRAWRVAPSNVLQRMRIALMRRRAMRVTAHAIRRASQQHISEA
jgi:hypothetical protein